MTPGQLCIAAMGALGTGCASVDEMAAHMGIERKRASQAACRLIRRGLVERLERGSYQLSEAGRTMLTSDDVLKFGQISANRRRAPSLGSLRQRAWNAMRLTRKFTLADIVTLAANELDGNPEHNLHRYFRALTLAGFLAELPTRSPGTALTSNGYKRWLLVRDSGETAPTVQVRAGIVVDHNTGETHSILRPGEGRHVAP